MGSRPATRAVVTAGQLRPVPDSAPESTAPAAERGPEPPHGDAGASGDTSPRVFTVACPASSFDSFDSVSSGKSNGLRIGVSGGAPTIWAKTSTTYDTG